MGRSTELEELDRLLESAHGGRSGRLLLVGDPGIGTSALLDSLMERCQAGNVDCIRMLGTEIGSPARLVAAQSALTSDPSVLLVDDAYLADESAVASFRAAVAGHLDRSVSIAVATRAGSAAARLLAAWPTLQVPPLTADESARLLELTLDREHSPTVLFRLADALGGNPCALRLVPWLLSAEQLTGMRPLPTYLPMPAHLVEAWAGTLDAQPCSARAAALDLAVSGPRLDLLAAMRQDGGWHDDDLAALADAGLVRMAPGSAPDLVHPVVRHVIAACSGSSALRVRHGRAATLGHRLGLPPREVVGHLVNSVATPDAKVADAIEVEARRAETLDQRMVASEAWQAAARLSVSGPDRIGRGLRALHLVIAHGLDYPDTDALLDLLAGEQLEAECALWVEWLRSLQRSEADPSAALTAQWGTIRRARSAAPDSLRGLLWDAAMNAWSLGDVEAGLRAAEEYCDVERNLGCTSGIEPPWTGTALLSAALFQAGRVAEAMPLRAQAISAAAAADAAGVPFDRLLSTVFIDDLLLDTSPEAADRVLVAAQRAQDESAAIACLDGIRAWRSRASGSWQESARLLVRGRTVARRTGATGAELGMAALACELAALQGDDEVLESEGAHLRAQAERIGDRRRLATLDRAIGMRALVAGHLDEAAAWLMSAGDVAFLGRGLRDAVIPSRVDLVDVLLRQGDHDEAALRADRVCAILSEMTDPLARALELRVRALVHDDLDLLLVALEAHAEAHDPFEEARTRLLLGERLRRDRQRSSARLHLLTAHRLFDALGAVPWCARVNAEMRVAGGEAESHADLSSLTPQETAVARAVARGRSNREVAEELFLSPRTVEYHLASVYRKLGVRGRTALVRMFTEA